MMDYCMINGQKQRYRKYFIRPTFGKLEKNYGVTIEHKGSSKKTIKFDYEMKILFSPFEPNYTVTLDRGQVYVNNQLPSLKAEELAFSLGQILYPIKFLMRPDRSFINIMNLKQIQERWHSKKDSIAKYFRGDIVHVQLNKMEKMLGNKYRLENSIKKNLFLNLYFIPLYQEYENNVQIPHCQSFALFPFSDLVEFSILSTVDPELSLSGKKIVDIQGKIVSCDPTAISEGEVSLLYKFNSDGSIFSIEGLFKILNGDNKEKDIEVKIFDKDTESMDEIINEETKAKRSLFDTFFNFIGF